MMSFDLIANRSRFSLYSMQNSNFIVIFVVADEFKGGYDGHARFLGRMLKF